MTKEELIRRFRKERYDPRVIQAFNAVQRELFVPDPSFAYVDHALAIGHGQTISQPTTIMILLTALDIKPEHKLLEIGAGSGYTAALLSLLAKEVYSTEIVPALVELARRNTQGCRNVHVLQAQGWGYPQEAPYDRIIVHAACAKIHPALLAQLKDDGILLAPVGEGVQRLVRVRRAGKRFVEEQLPGTFVFVPFIES
jgi:protein-L-isoaspartate(D-aspartate) O-methyltransferase